MIVVTIVVVVDTNVVVVVVTAASLSTPNIDDLCEEASDEILGVESDVNSVSEMSCDQMSSRQAVSVVDLDVAVLQADDDVVFVDLEVEHFGVAVAGMNRSVI